MAIDFWRILDPFSSYFWRVFLIRFAGYRNVHFDTAATCEILHFPSQSPPVYEFCLADEVRKIVKIFFGKIKIITWKMHSEWEDLSDTLFGNILALFWLHVGSILEPQRFPKPSKIASGEVSTRKKVVLEASPCEKRWLLSPQRRLPGGARLISPPYVGPSFG